MCEFMSWLQTQEEPYSVLFLTDKELIKWERDYYENRIICQDLLGHGAIMTVMGLSREAYTKMHHGECNDFRDPARFPIDAAKALLRGEMNTMLTRGLWRERQRRMVYYDMAVEGTYPVTMKDLRFVFDPEVSESARNEFRNEIERALKQRGYIHEFENTTLQNIDYLLTWRDTPQGDDYWRKKNRDYGKKALVAYIGTHPSLDVAPEMITGLIKDRTQLNPEWQAFITRHNL